MKRSWSKMWLVVTEKCGPLSHERDGGAQLVASLQKALGSHLKIMQFGPSCDPRAKWHFTYPHVALNRFERRVANAKFIAQKVKAVEDDFSHVIFVHISMQFGLTEIPLRKDLEIWTFPMFLTPSYRASGETVPEAYVKMETLTLANCPHIITPSYLEKEQLMREYQVKDEQIRVMPRGVNRSLLSPQIRSCSGPPSFCSVGSIKPQKNTLGLIQLFEKIQNDFPGATLKLIGPIQDEAYAFHVKAVIEQLHLQDHIEWTGYVPPHAMGSALESTHLHLSTSHYETFGRAIFETLAAGLPNVAKFTGNAAAQFLQQLPYARFVDDQTEMLKAIKTLLGNLPLFSSLALEIGDLYDDEWLSQWLAAILLRRDVMAISDVDGTLFHKSDPEKTQRSIQAFQSFSTRVICTARPLENLLRFLADHQLTVEWIIASSGAVVTDGEGAPLFITPLDDQTIADLDRQVPHHQKIFFQDQTLQISTTQIPSFINLRTEVYQGTAFISHWRASKLHAVHRLLRQIKWTGQIRTFGDGPYDAELLRFFDGMFITPYQEVVYV